MTAENQAKAGVAGGVDVALNILNSYMSYPDTCELGCGSLWGMVASSGKALTIRYKYITSNCS